MLRCALAALLLVLGAASAAELVAADALDLKVQAYFQTHCLACHSEKSEESDFRIDALSPKVSFENTPQRPEIMERISSGEMPPKEQRNRPSAAESAAVVEWLAAREGRVAARGRVF